MNKQSRYITEAELQEWSKAIVPDPFEKEAIIKRCPKKHKDDRPSDEQRWCLFDSKGQKLLGRHPSKEKALKQERAIQVHKHSSDEQIIQDVLNSLN